MQTDISQLNDLAREIRLRLVEMSHRARLAHLGSALSCLDILVAAYFAALRIDPARPLDPGRDRFILSKGHAASALYAVLAYRGFMPRTSLDRYGEPDSGLCEHPAPACAPGVEAATGSLGHGLPLGLGMALAGRISQRDYRVWVLMSDGEMNEGSVWEAAMFAPAHGLDNLVAVVDFNRWQATGRSCEVMSLLPLREKWESFGWSAHEVDGHDLKSLAGAFAQAPTRAGKPTIFIAHTVKGKGVSFMEDDNNWHYRVPDEQELAAARKELSRA